MARITVDVYTDPTPRRCVAILTLPAVPRRGDVIRIAPGQRADDQPAEGPHEDFTVHAVIWDIHDRPPQANHDRVSIRLLTHRETSR